MEIIATISTIFIAFIALGLAIVEFRAMRKHNRLSLKPFLSFDVNYDDTDTGIGIWLTNKGVGPAVIECIKVSLDGNDVTGPPERPFLIVLTRANLNYKFIKHYALQADTPVSAGDRLPLLVTDQGLDSERRHRVKTVFPRIGITIRYKSIYDEPFETELPRNQELLGDEEWKSV